MKTPILELKNLKTHFQTEAGVAKAVDGVDFSVYPGEMLGVVGESGSGKSVTALSILRLIPHPPGFFADGEIIYKGKNLLSLSYEEMRQYRGKEISMIFQEPMTSLNPIFTIKTQVEETIKQYQPNLSKAEITKIALSILEKVGIPDPEKRLKDYPYQYSGGMRQRVMIAMAIVNKPQLLIADEPTTALDVTIQAQILDLILSLRAEDPDSAVIFITHDLAVIAETCDRVIVMYGGKIQEIADVYSLYRDPQHPYTIGLMESIPHPDSNEKTLKTIKGTVPSLFEMPKGCKFCTRCPHAFDLCFTEEPKLIKVSENHLVRCHKSKKGV